MAYIPLISEMFAPALDHLSVECVLRIRYVGLHMLLQIRVMLGLIMCGKCAYLRSLSTKFLIKHGNTSNFDLTT
jgi:hypothetical protein